MEGAVSRAHAADVDVVLSEAVVDSVVAAVERMLRTAPALEDLCLFPRPSRTRGTTRSWTLALLELGTLLRNPTRVVETTLGTRRAPPRPRQRLLLKQSRAASLQRLPRRPGPACLRSPSRHPRPPSQLLLHLLRNPPRPPRLWSPKRTSKPKLCSPKSCQSLPLLTKFRPRSLKPQLLSRPRPCRKFRKLHLPSLLPRRMSLPKRTSRICPMLRSLPLPARLLAQSRAAARLALRRRCLRLSAPPRPHVQFWEDLLPPHTRQLLLHLALAATKGRFWSSRRLSSCRATMLLTALLCSLEAWD